MKSFLNWLIQESKVDIRIASIMNNGMVTIYIDGIKYVYLTDPVYHTEWKRMKSYTPGHILNQIKNMVQKGHARQIEPEPEPVAKSSFSLSGTSLDSCPNCGTSEPHYISGLECPGCGS